MTIWASSSRDLTQNLVVFPFLVASIIAHELAHARAASLSGVPVRHIVLIWFGGFAEFWMAAKSRWSEAAIAIAGPAANLAIAGVGFTFLYFFASQESAFQLFFEGSVRIPYEHREPLAEVVANRLAWFNLAIGLFNLLPGLPLDGGHVLRAGLSTRMSRGRAGWIAAWCGFFIGLAIVIYAVWVESMWALIIGAFIAGSAWLERRRMRYE
ncbi:MAG: site-2 protease family protein [Caulobacteraceae bacterium]